MEPMPLNIPHYPMLRFIARHGRRLVFAIALALLVVGLIMLPQVDTRLAGVVVIVVSGVVMVVGRALVEMVELITDMLLPK